MEEKIMCTHMQRVTILVPDKVSHTTIYRPMPSEYNPPMHELLSLSR